MTLTASQLTTLKSNLSTNTNTVLINGVATAINVVPQGAQNAQTIANWYNLSASPAFWVWMDISSLSDTGKAIKMSDVGNLTTANSTRLQVSFQIRPDGFVPSSQDDRSLFSGIFSVAGASGTRTNLLAIWQRQATNIEKLFATGTGTQATGDMNSDGSLTVGSPGVLVVVGPITATDIENAWAS